MWLALLHASCTQTCAGQLRVCQLHFLLSPCTCTCASSTHLDASERRQRGEAQRHEKRVRQLGKQLRRGGVHGGAQLLHQLAGRLQRAQHARRAAVAGDAPLLSAARGAEGWEGRGVGGTWEMWDSTKLRQ